MGKMMEELFQITAIDPLHHDHRSVFDLHKVFDVNNMRVVHSREQHRLITQTGHDLGVVHVLGLEDLERPAFVFGDVVREAHGPIGAGGDDAFDVKLVGALVHKLVLRHKPSVKRYRALIFLD